MRLNDAVIGLTLIIFGGAVLFHTRGFPELEEGYPGPSLFPNVLAILFMITGIVLVLQGIRSRKPLAAVERHLLGGKGLANILAVLAAIVMYIFFSESLGFLAISFLLLFLLMKWLRAATFLCLCMACGVTLGIYVLFAKLLLVPLPWGLFGW
jgi:putative tricarboxylic transport membrane protein